MAVEQIIPNTVKSVTDYNYVGSSTLAQGIHMPQVDKDLVRRYGRQDLTGFIEMLSNKEEVAGLEITHYEKDFIHSLVKFDASTGTAATKTLSIASAYSFNISANTSPYIATGTTATYTPRKYDIIEFPDGTEAQVTAVSGSSVTVYPTNASSIPAVTTSDEIIIKGNAMNEGSSPVDSRQSRLLDEVNYVQIFRDDIEVTNTEAGMESWIELEGPNGQKGYVYYLEALADTYHRFRNERELQLLTGQKLTNATLAQQSGFETVVKTEGLIPQIENGGIVEDYSTSSGLTMTDIDNMILTMDKFRSGREHMIMCGIELRQDINELFRGEVTSGGFDAAKNGGIVFQTFNGERAEALNFDFDAFTQMGYRFAVQQSQIFSDPNTLGAAGHKYKGLGIVIPTDNQAVYNSRNATTAVTVPSLTLMHTSDTQGSREMREWVTGYGMGARTNGDDKFVVHYLSQSGLRVAAKNRFGLFNPTS